MTLETAVKKLVKETMFHTPFRRYVFPRYVYEFTPAQLCFLCRCLDETGHLAGQVCEVGCSTGATTIFLNRYLDSLSVSKAYCAVDTFSGFVPEDIDFEVVKRGKTRHLYAGKFGTNKKKWFDGTMSLNGVTRVRSIQADVNRFDLRTLAPISFVLLDVDLYRPIQKALPELYEALTPGGIIVVDDCDPSKIRWDGADQAYKEYMHGLGRPAEITHGKLGVVRKTS